MCHVSVISNLSHIATHCWLDKLSKFSIKTMFIVLKTNKINKKRFLSKFWSTKKVFFSFGNFSFSSFVFSSLRSLCFQHLLLCRGYCVSFFVIDEGRIVVSESGFLSQNEIQTVWDFLWFIEQLLGEIYLENFEGSARKYVVLPRV